MNVFTSIYTVGNLSSQVVTTVFATFMRCNRYATGSRTVAYKTYCLLQKKIAGTFLFCICLELLLYLLI